MQCHTTKNSIKGFSKINPGTGVLRKIRNVQLSRHTPQLSIEKWVCFSIMLQYYDSSLLATSNTLGNNLSWFNWESFKSYMISAKNSVPYIFMYHFHTSDQRVQPVHVSHILHWFWNENSIRNAPANATLNQVLHRRHNTRNSNCHLCGEGERSGAQRRT